MINCAAAEEEERGYEKHREDERRRIAAEQSLHGPSALGVCVCVRVCVCVYVHVCVFNTLSTKLADLVISLEVNVLWR